MRRGAVCGGTARSPGDAHVFPPHAAHSASPLARRPSFPRAQSEYHTHSRFAMHITPAAHTARPLTRPRGLSHKHKRAQCASCTMLPCDLPTFSVSRTRARARRRHIDYEAGIWASFSKWALIVQVPACPRRVPCRCMLARVGQCTRHGVIIPCLDALDRQIAPKGHGNQRPTWRLIWCSCCRCPLCWSWSCCTSAPRFCCAK